jgi:hypothetical protein
MLVQRDCLPLRVPAEQRCVRSCWLNAALIAVAQAPSNALRICLGELTSAFSLLLCFPQVNLPQVSTDAACIQHEGQTVLPEEQARA